MDEMPATPDLGDFLLVVWILVHVAGFMIRRPIRIPWRKP